MDFDDIVNRAWGEIPEPKLLPGGQWLMAGKNVALVKPREEGQPGKVLWSYKAKSPVDVGADLLEELGDDYDPSINEVTYTTYIESAADWDKVRKHLLVHGIEVQPTDALFDSNGKLAFNKKFRDAEIVATVGQRSYENNDNETIWQNTLSGFKAVE